MLLGFREIGAFDVRHEKLSWPWIVFDPAHVRFAHPKSEQAIVVRSFVDGTVVEGATFSSPIPLPSSARSVQGTAPGLHAFALDPTGERLAITGVEDGRSIVCILSPTGVVARATIAELLGDGFGGQALHFDRTGERLWLAAERDGGGVLALLDARTLAVVGTVDLPEYPPPATYELALHPVEDAVLLLAACGQDGTFARVARFTGSAVEPISTAMDGGIEPAGLAGFSNDGSRVFLVEAEQLRAHGWPGLEVERTVEFGDEFESSYAGMVVDDVVFVDGEDVEDGDDVVVAHEASTLQHRPSPTAIRGAMWAGRLANRALVTVTPKGDPARGTVMQFLPAR